MKESSVYKGDVQILHAISTRGIPGSARGQAAIILVLALTMLLGFVAMAVDGGLIYSERRHAQNASDASSLAGGASAALSLENSLATYQGWNCSSAKVGNAKGAAITAAINRAMSNDFVVDNNAADRNGVSVVCGVQNNGSFVDKYLDVTTLISHTIDTHFMRFVYTGAIVNNVAAVTRVRPRTPMVFGNAIVSLREDCPSTSTGGVHFDGNNQVAVNGGGIFSNSCMKAAGNVDVNVTGGFPITCMDPGCYTQSGNPNVSPPPTENGVRMPEVMSEIPDPVCSSVPVSQVSGNTIDPGRYGDIRLTNGDTLNLNPGLYCVNSLTMNGGELSGNDVTIYVTGGDFKVTGGKANIDAPPARGCTFCPPPVPGVLIYLALGNQNEVVLTGNSVSNYEGLVYAPNGTIEVGGTAGEASPINAQLVADTVFIHGNAQVSVNFDGNTTPEIPAMLELFK